MYKSTIAAMLTIDETVDEEIVVSGYEAENDGGGGIFIWKATTTRVADSGICFAASSVIGGYFERQITGDFIHVKWYNVNGSSLSVGTDDKAKLQAAFDGGAALGKKVVSDKAYYKVKGGLTIKGDVDFNGSTLFFEGVTIDALVAQDREGDVLNLNIDGTGVNNCIYGLFVDTNYPTTRVSRYKMRIENLKNGDNTKSCNGAVFYKADSASTYPSNKYDISINCRNIHAAPDTMAGIGDNGGSAAAILFSMNGPGTNAQVMIRDLEIDGCGPKKDSVGICIFTVDYQNEGQGQFLIENVVVRNCEKRGIKIQAPNTTIRNATVYGEQTDICFDTYSSNTQFVGCKALNIAGSGFYTDYKDTLIRDCLVTTLPNITEATAFPMIVAQSLSERLRIDNVRLVQNREFNNAFTAVISSLSASEVFIQNTIFRTPKTTGNFISAANAGKIHVDNVTAEGLSNGLLIGDSACEIRVSNSHFISRNNCILKQVGIALATVYTHNSTYESQYSTALNLNGSTYKCMLYMNDCTVKAKLHGILPYTGSRVKNTTVENTSTGTPKVGTGISIENGQIDGCRVKNFDEGIVWSFSTVEEMTNNTVLDCGDAFVPSYLPTPTMYVNYNNIEKP
jgi:hypothetical protein